MNNIIDFATASRRLPMRRQSTMHDGTLSSDRPDVQADEGTMQAEIRRALQLLRESDLDPAALALVVHRIEHPGGRGDTDKAADLEVLALLEANPPNGPWDTEAGLTKEMIIGENPGKGRRAKAIRRLLDEHLVVPVAVMWRNKAGQQQFKTVFKVAVPDSPGEPCGPTLRPQQLLDSTRSMKDVNVVVG